MEVLDDKTLYDLICILQGQFNPLKTFMDKSDWYNVCKNLHLSNMKFFPLPITLAVDKDKYKLDETIKLSDSTNYPLAELMITEIYEPDIDFECLNAYGTMDDNHPYVKYKNTHKGKVYISGPLKKLNDPRLYDFLEYRYTPEASKELFENRGWKNIIGFQTRNPMHKAHYELTKYALSQVEDSRLFLNPVVGVTQTVDIDYHIRVNCYKKLLEHYEDDMVELCLLPLTMRMAGPREACLHALIRKNYGCTHFVVGRDHAGPSYKTKDGKKFYGDYDAQDLLIKYSSKIGIVPIVSKMIVYNETKKEYQPIDVVPENDKILKLSGTEFRRKIRNNEKIPDWFSFPEIIDILKSSVKEKGKCYYFIGLPCSGKTTYANILKAKLLEKYPSKAITILDGDVVRQNLSKGLGFSREDRSTNVRRIGYVASEIVKHGGVVICANIAPYDEDRLLNRKMIEEYGEYKEIWVDTSLEICEKRDVKGLYKLAREGKIKEFTGISDPFEVPSNYDYRIDMEDYDIIKLI